MAELGPEEIDKHSDHCQLQIRLKIWLSGEGELIQEKETYIGGDPSI
jgi:hypothetical protein